MMLFSIVAASDPVLDDSIPRDLPVRQLRGEMKAASASQDGLPTAEESHDEKDDKNDDTVQAHEEEGADDGTDDGTDDENDDENDETNEGDFHDATEVGDEPDLDAQAVENACVNQTGWDKDFENRMYTCAVKHSGNAKKGGKCMSEKQGVSRDCGRCMGKLMRCSVRCATKCCAGKCMKKWKCRKCVRGRCAASFEKCAGVDAP